MEFRRGDKKNKVSPESALARRGRTIPLLFHEQLVGKRLYINAQVRFLVVAGIVVGALGAKYILGVEDLNVSGLVALAALLGAFNIAVFLFARRHGNLERRASVYRRVMGITHLTIGVDFVFLTVALWFVGGAHSPFRAFYLLHVVLAAALLSPLAAYAHTAFGYALFAGLVLGQWAGILPLNHPTGLVSGPAPLDGRFVVTELLLQALLMALAVYLVTSLTHLLRRGEQELRTSKTELERLSRLQRDFLHIALHDLKAPVSAALMLLRSMSMVPGPPLAEQQVGWLERIRTRLNEASAFLHDFGVLAALEAADLDGQAESLDVAALIENVLTENQDLLDAHHHTIKKEMADTLPHISGVKRLIHEAVANLITNADKYTPPNGTIAVRARAKDGMVRIEVEDNGIGIAPEDQKRLFQEFVRIKRSDSAVGNVAGSGLGLSLVRRIVEAQGGNVGVVSELNKGSTFFIQLPVGREVTSH